MFWVISFTKHHEISIYCDSIVWTIILKISDHWSSWETQVVNAWLEVNFDIEGYLGNWVEHKETMFCNISPVVRHVPHVWLSLGAILEHVHETKLWIKHINQWVRLSFEEYVQETKVTENQAQLPIELSY